MTATCDVFTCQNPTQYIRPCYDGCGIVHHKCDAHWVILQLTSLHYQGDIVCSCGYREPVQLHAMSSLWTDITKKESK